MQLRFWGTRGSIATPGPDTNFFGGNTSCVELITNSSQRIVFDCGTGARLLGIDLMANAVRPITASILLSHSHWDHIQGFPFFAPAFVPGSNLTVYGPEGCDKSLPDVLAGQMEYTYFPVELGQLAAAITYVGLGEGCFQIDGVLVKSQYLNHPAVTLGYRVESDDLTIVYACDHEPFSTTLWSSDSQTGSIDVILHQNDRRHALFMLDADVVIHDAQYTSEEYPGKKNWGHSPYEYVVRLAMAARVRKLFLTHHDPTHDDAFLRQMEKRAQEIVKDAGSDLIVSCASEGYVETLQSRVCAIRPSNPESAQTVDSFSTPRLESTELRVLVVDDDDDLRLLACRILSKAGFMVSQASGGVEALAMIGNNKPDLVLLDIVMQDLNGIEVLQALRSKPEFASLPVIVMTGYGDDATTRQSFAAGATDFVSKPFTPPQLNARVRACFARAASANGQN